MNYKTVYVTKKGFNSLNVDIRKLGYNTKFRYKIQNIGSKTAIPYTFYSSTPYGYAK